MEDPGQPSASPAAPLRHPRFLVRVPPSHSAEQSSQLSQSDQIGHGPSLQVAVWTDWPGQASKPRPRQGLNLVLVPAPHVWEHENQGVQLPHELP